MSLSENISTIRDWIYLEYQLNSTSKLEEKSAVIAIEDRFQLVINVVGDIYAINLLNSKNKIVKSDQIKNGAGFESKFAELFGPFFAAKVELPQSKSGQSRLLEQVFASDVEKGEKLNSPLADDRSKLLLSGSGKPAAVYSGTGSGNNDSPPGFDDEHQILSQGNYSRPLNPPPSFGDRDLQPPGVGPNPTLAPYIDPLRSTGGSGGMHPTSNDPIFHPNSSGSNNGNDLRRPPGARWDDPLSGDSDDLNRIGQGLPGSGNFGRRNPPGPPGFGGGPGGFGGLGGPGGSGFGF